MLNCANVAIRFVCDVTVCLNPCFSSVTNGSFTQLLPVACQCNAGRKSSSVHSNHALLQRLQTQSLFTAWLRHSAEAPMRRMQRQRAPQAERKGRIPASLGAERARMRKQKGKAEVPERGRNEQQRGRIPQHLWRRLRVSIQWLMSSLLIAHPHLPPVNNHHATILEHRAWADICVCRRDREEGSISELACLADLKS